MEVTLATWVVAIGGLVLIGLLGSLQLVAILRPRTAWTVSNVYGGDPESTDPTAFFAFNQGLAWADPVFWAPLQIAGSIGMMVGEPGVSCSLWPPRCPSGTRPSRCSSGTVTSISARTRSPTGSPGESGRSLASSKGSIPSGDCSTNRSLGGGGKVPGSAG